MVQNNELLLKKDDSVASDMDALCRNSIELIEYARHVAARQVNLTQLMTFYSLGLWIVEEEQQGENRAEYGKQIVFKLSEALMARFGRGFSVDTLERARKFYLTYQDRISETFFMNSPLRNPQQCCGILNRAFHSRSPGLIICC